MFKRTSLALALMTAASIAAAEPVRFDFTFQEPQGPAQAVGHIVLETDVIENPGGGAGYDVPSSAVLDLSVTVSGASAGNGTFDMASFCGINFDTGGGTLDFGLELVGQPTANDPWGTIPQGKGDESGDFNLFINCGPGNPDRYEDDAPIGGGSTAPNGVFFYTLGADGGSANQMVLVSMIAAGGPAPRHPVPATNLWTLAGLLALTAGFGIAALRKRRA